MWPDEESLEDALSDPSGNSHFSRSWADGEHESREGMTQEIVASRSEDDAVKNEGAGDASEGGLGAGGGLREEWEMMTPDEKVCKLLRGFVLPGTWCVSIQNCLCVAMLLSLELARRRNIVLRRYCIIQAGASRSFCAHALHVLEDEPHADDK